MLSATAAPAWHFAACFGLSIVSALLPWVNGEAVVVSFAAFTRAPADLAALALVAATGQMLGKCLLYWFGSRGGHLSADRQGRLQRWRDRLEGHPVQSLGLVFISSTIGIPPLYLTTLAAGAVGMRFARFLGAAGCGRVIRFAAVAFSPGLVLGWWR